jgi:hypothetical protein
MPDRHRGNRSAEGSTSTVLKISFRHKLQKKEAGAAGGESGARSYGPALGGEAGSVLMDKLNRKFLPYATTSVVFATTGGVSATGTRCGVSQSNYNIWRRV